MKNLLPELLYYSYFENLILCTRGKAGNRNINSIAAACNFGLHDLRQGGQLLSVSTSLSVKQGKGQPSPPAYRSAIRLKNSVGGF